MSDRFGTLRDKYRAATHDRLGKVCQLLRNVEGASDNRLTNAMAELHAIKGESSMVGFDLMSQLAHQIESYVAHRRANAETSYREVADAVDALVTVFDQSYEAVLEDPSIGELLCELSAAVPQPSAPRAEHQKAGEVAKRTPIGSSPADATSDGETERTREPSAPGGANVDASSKATSGGMQTRDARARFTRIDATRIDELCDAIAEATLKLGSIESDLSQFALRFSEDDAPRMLVALTQRFVSVRSEFNDVAASAWALRLMSVAPRLEELAEYGASLARSLQKQIVFEVDAGGVELERNVLDELGEPLLHIVRNSVDHGIELPVARNEKPETACVRLRAEGRGANVLVSIEDDGAGLDATAIRERAVALGLLTRERAGFLADTEALDLIFLERFTQREVANSISGRGVGLSAARRKVEAIGGAIRVESRLGEGARFEILVPSTLSRERVLLLEIANTCCCIPARWVTAVVTDPLVVSSAKDKRYVTHIDRLVVVRSVAEWLSLSAGVEGTLVVVEIAGRAGAFLVDRVLGERDILRVAADQLLALGQRVEASGVLDDGATVLFLRWAEALRASAQRRSVEPHLHASPARTPTVLVVDDSPIIRDIVSEVLISAGLHVLTAEDGLVAAQLLENGSCDLVISDVEMPQLSGLELLERIRRTNDALPVIMLTTRSSPESRRKAASLGANAYIVKSEFRGSVLLDVVRQFVEVPT